LHNRCWLLLLLPLSLLWGNGNSVRMQMSFLPMLNIKACVRARVCGPNNSITHNINERTTSDNSKACPKFLFCLLSGGVRQKNGWGWWRRVVMAKASSFFVAKGESEKREVFLLVVAKNSEQEQT